MKILENLFQKTAFIKPWWSPPKIPVDNSLVPALDQKDPPTVVTINYKYVSGEQERILEAIRGSL